jgi:ribosomal protein S18 acetylase RimI-like enzyme
VSNYTYRRPKKENITEMRLMAQADSRIPLEFDSRYEWSEASIQARLEYYNQISDADFFEMVLDGEKMIGFHIVRKTAYPPNHFIGNIVSLWVHSDYRGQGIASELKKRSEAWAKKLKLTFMQTSVHKNNKRMIEINEANGYETAYINMRKRLDSDPNT